MNYGSVTFLFIWILWEVITLSADVTSEADFSVSRDRVRRENSPKPKTCRLCRGRPRKCTCYLWKEINGKKRCSYNDKVGCDSGKEDVPKENIKEESRFPKYKVTKTAPEYFNTSLEQICGKSLVEEEPQSQRLPRRRRGRIINGTRAEYGRWPWQVSLRVWNSFSRGYIHKCGASLVSRTWVITAGHCVVDDRLSNIQLVLGEHDIYNDREQFTERKIKLKRKIVHPDFEPVSLENDLALLELRSAVTLQENIIPVCLHTEEDSLVGARGWLTGWGLTRQGGSLAPVLRQLEVPILSNKRCELLYRRAGHPQYIPDIFMCAGYSQGGRDSCDGDSGGPLGVQLARGADIAWHLAGVVSWGIGCGERDQPGVMVRLARYTRWIQQHITLR